jgi:hypothetical protein
MSSRVSSSGTPLTSNIRRSWPTFRCHQSVPWNSTLPVRSCAIKQPIDHESTCSLSKAPRPTSSTSGARYESELRNGTPLSDMHVAWPKPPILTTMPPPTTRTFFGTMLRWTMPRSCIALASLRICRITWHASFSENGLLPPRAPGGSSGGRRASSGRRTP